MCKGLGGKVGCLTVKSKLRGREAVTCKQL